MISKVGYVYQRSNMISEDLYAISVVRYDIGGPICYIGDPICYIGDPI